MTTENQIQSNVAQVDLDIDELFNGTPGAGDVIIPAEKEKKSIFSSNKQNVDMSFADSGNSSDDDEPEGDEPAGNDPATKNKPANENYADILDSLTDDDDDEENVKATNRGRKKIEGINDVFEKLIKDEKIIPFDDDKPIEEYSLKDWEELIQANLEERANQARRETPKQFFESLPQELQIAAKYVADGGQDLKGLFSTLAQVEATRDLNPKVERDQEYIVREYLNATGFGSPEEIQEEIETWKDLGKLEQQAMKFKPKLDKMEEQVVAQKLQEQEMRKQQQQQASQMYMENVYNTLKDGQLGDIKIDRKTQAMLYNGLVQPNYPSVSGKNTNLLGHLLEKYQFVEPNYNIISEALWLLSDPEGYKNKIMEKGSQKQVENTVRKLKTEQANAGGTSSLGINDDVETKRSAPGKKLPRANNFFKRF
jgi:hypothetical protein